MIDCYDDGDDCILNLEKCVLSSEYKNQVRDLESNQTLIAKPFPELVTSRLAINHEDDDDDIDDDDEGQDNVKIMIMV